MWKKKNDIGVSLSYGGRVEVFDIKFSQGH